jgi:two-component system copper resistance phosphate regulon response regulator CusR
MRILVAEDHPSLARSIADGLRDDGYAVDLTFDGNEALHLAGSNPYDAIILDVMLPGRDGFSIIQVLRRRDVQVPILCLTAKDAVTDRVKGLDLGADDYLVKPFAWEELLARVRSMVRRGHGQKSALVTVGDLEIDTARKSAKRAGNAIDLSAREYALLEYLAHRQGQVVSRSDIWEHLYDQHDETTSNVVDVYIGYLRAKVDKDYPTKLIHTRRGQGYLLGVEA